MGTIVIGYEGSDKGDDALALGGVLAETLAAQPLVVAIATWPGYLMDDTEVDQALHAELDPVLESAAGRLRGLDPVTRAGRARSVSEELSAIASAEGATAIVIGSSHRSTVGRVALGSVGTSLIHGAPCAMAVAPRGFAATDERQLLRIAVAFDASPEASSALDAAIGLAERTHGRLTVLTVADFPTYGYAAAWSVYSGAGLPDAEQQAKQQTLEGALNRVPEGLPVEGRVLTGPAGTLLTEASAEFDLLLMGSRGYGPIGRTFLGGVAHHVIHSAECPVLVLPRGAGADPLGLTAPPR